jgi:hypothetical protein
MLVLGTAVMLLSMIPLGANAQDKYVPKENEELYGTWTNEQNGKGFFNPQKEIVSPGELKMYHDISDPVPYAESTMGIESKWTDSEGNIWYKTFGTDTAGPNKGDRWQELDKFSKSGKVWERVFSLLGTAEFKSSYFPIKIDPKAQYYGILYREEK